MKGLAKLNISLGIIFVFGSIISLFHGTTTDYESINNLVSLGIGVWFIVIGYWTQKKKRYAYYSLIVTYSLFTLYYLFSIVYYLVSQGFNSILIIYGFAIIVFLYFIIMAVKDNKSDFI